MGSSSSGNAQISIISFTVYIAVHKADLHLKISSVLQVEKMTSQQTALSLNNSPKKITLKEYWGPLVLIIVGIIVSVIAAVAETMYFKYKGRVSQTCILA